jgi:SPP1 family predicted phage head-tail adaptor
MRGIEKFYKPGIVIERKTDIKKAGGAVKQEWAPHITISGQIRPLSGDERLSADKKTLFASHRLYTDPADITEADRVNDNGLIYDIKFVHDPMNFGRFLQIDLELML